MLFLELSLLIAHSSHNVKVALYITLFRLHFIVFDVGLRTPDPDLEIVDAPPEEDIPTTKAGRVKFLVSVLFYVLLLRIITFRSCLREFNFISSLFIRQNVYANRESASSPYWEMAIVFTDALLMHYFKTKTLTWKVCYNFLWHELIISQLFFLFLVKSEYSTWFSKKLRGYRSIHVEPFSDVSTSFCILHTLKHFCRFL